MTHIAEHPTRENTIYCAVVLDVYSRRVVGWSIDAAQTSVLVTNALAMVIDSRTPNEGEGPGWWSRRSWTTFAFSPSARSR